MAANTVSDKFAQVMGFRVEIDDAGVRELDTAWETFSVGEVIIGWADMNTPGHKYIEKITLRGAVTDKRAALCMWINETVNGKLWKRTVTITELLSVDGGVKPGKRFICSDCFPTQYRYPALFADMRHAAEEEVQIAVGRMDVADSF